MQIANVQLEPQEIGAPTYVYISIPEVYPTNRKEWVNKRLAARADLLSLIKDELHCRIDSEYFLRLPILSPNCKVLLEVCDEKHRTLELFGGILTAYFAQPDRATEFLDTRIKLTNLHPIA